jgi:hypothetical protein
MNGHRPRGNLLLDERNFNVPIGPHVVSFAEGRHGREIHALPSSCEVKAGCDRVTRRLSRLPYWTAEAAANHISGFNRTPFHRDIAYITICY